MIKAFFDWLYGRLIDSAAKPKGGGAMSFGAHWWLGTGYSAEDERMRNADKIREACQFAVTAPMWVAHDITGDGKDETFCNRAAGYIASSVGWFGFKANDSANYIIHMMEHDPEHWREIPWRMASEFALKGALAFLCVQEDPHGHLTAVMPQQPEPSGSWGEPVPIVAHVGKAPNGIKRASQAYLLAHREKLRAFVLVSTMV